MRLAAPFVVDDCPWIRSRGKQSEPRAPRFRGPRNRQLGHLARLASRLALVFRDMCTQLIAQAVPIDPRYAYLVKPLVDSAPKIPASSVPNMGLGRGKDDDARGWWSTSGSGKLLRSVLDSMCRYLRAGF
jgi:hypothetical protein